MHHFDGLVNTFNRPRLIEKHYYWVRYVKARYYRYPRCIVIGVYDLSRIDNDTETRQNSQLALQYLKLSRLHKPMPRVEIGSQRLQPAALSQTILCWASAARACRAQLNRVGRQRRAEPSLEYFSDENHWFWVPKTKIIGSMNLRAFFKGVARLRAIIVFLKLL